jgi:hypothetical protein
MVHAMICFSLGWGLSLIEIDSELTAVAISRTRMGVENQDTDDRRKQGEYPLCQHRCCRTTEFCDTNRRRIGAKCCIRR